MILKETDLRWFKKGKRGVEGEAIAFPSASTSAWNGRRRRCGRCSDAAASAVISNRASYFEKNAALVLFEFKMTRRIGGIL